MLTSAAFSLSRSAESVVARFDGVKPKPGGGWLARCPAHEDRQQSLSIDAGGGKILIKCFAGCDPGSIVAAKGLTLADLFLEAKPEPAGPRVAPTVEMLARAKGLPVATLRRFGVRNVAELSKVERLQHGVKASDGVWIPYFNQDGSIAARTRWRSALVAKDGSRWCGDFGAPLPYGLHDLADAGDQGIVVICEGESDYWSLREMGAPAVGIPGASMVGNLKREYLPDGVQTVYVAQDADPAGAAFVAAARALCATWGLPTVPLRFPAGCKDANDFYRQDPATAADRLMALLAEAAAAEAPARREFSTAGEIYRYTLPEWGLTLEVDQIQRKWGDLVGELAVVRAHGPDVFRGSVNLSNVERRQGVALQVAKRAGLKEIDWPVLVEEFAVLCLKAERTGRPGVWLHEQAPATADRVVRVLGFEFPVDLPACIFGDGDTGKSFLSLFILGELARRGVRVGVVDAELEAAYHRTRLESIFGKDMPRIGYMRLDRPLAHSVDHVRRFVRDLDLQYLLYDSVGFMTPEPEKSDSALGYFRALRQVGVGSLSIAHITKARDLTPTQQKPFGSNFYHQSFRRHWYLQAQAEPEPDGRRVIGIWNNKGGVLGKSAPFGLALTIREGFASVEHAEIADADGLAQHLSVAKRVRAALKSGPRSAADLADVLEAKENAVRVALSKDKKKGLVVSLPGDLWGLPDLQK